MNSRSAKSRQNTSTIRQPQVSNTESVNKTEPLPLNENDKFDYKLRRVVQSLLETSPEFRTNANGVGIDAVDSFTKVTNSANPVFLRITWAVVLLACFTICTFQVYTIFSYYLSMPIVVDVKIKEEMHVQFPSITLGTADAAGTARLVKEYNITMGRKECSSPATVLIEKMSGINTDLMWQMLNYTSAVVMASVVTRNHVYELNLYEEKGHNGMKIRFELDKFLPYEGLDSRMVVKTKKFLHRCMVTILIVTIQPTGFTSDMQNKFVFKSLTTNDLMVTTQKFEFVNRPDQICLDDEEYLKCIRKCEVEKFGKFSCRFPFFPETVQAPSCISGPGMGNVYTLALLEYLTLHCQCPRRCHKTVFHVSVRYVKENRNETVLNMYLSTNVVVVIAERFAYDVISLLSDIGGNLGLCLGLSILSITEILLELASYVSKYPNSKTQNPILTVVPLIHQVKHLVAEELRQCSKDSSVPGLSSASNRNGSAILSYIYLGVLVTCITGSCLFIYIRTAKYWSVPTHMSIEIVNKDTVHFPNLTICGLTVSITEKLKELANTRRQFRQTSFNNNMEDWCSLHLTDLLDDPNVTAEDLWEQSSVLEEYKRAIDIGKMYFNKSFIENISYRNVNLPDGKCVEIHAGEQLFAGSNTQIYRLFKSNAFGKFDQELKECNRHYAKMYVTPPGELFHLSTHLFFPIGDRIMVIFETKKVTLWNTARKPCVDQSIAQKCYIQCLEKKLENRMVCRLPYIPSTLKNFKPLCNTSLTGKQSEANYMELAMSIDQLQYKECGCVQSCERTIITSSMYVEPHNNVKLTYFTFFFFSNIYEHIVEIPSDNISSLLCDIGGNLGSFLGVSVLSFFDVGQSMIKALLNLCKFRSK